MSAWLCTNRHHQFVAKAAEVHGLIPAGTADEFARRLKRENWLSLAARYPRDYGLFEDGQPDQPEINDELIASGGSWDISDIAGNVENGGYVHAAAGCVDYQSCEHEGWHADDNEVSRVVNALYDLTEDQPGEGPWGIE